jgi:hypothetical protein
MASRFDIKVELHFRGRDGLIDSEEVTKLLDVLETAAYDSDRSDVERAAATFPSPTGISSLVPTGISPLVKDASLERLRRYRQRRLLLEETRPGSLTLIGLIAAVSYFVLEKTIGESFSEGWKDSNLHRDLKTFFRKLIDGKVLFIVESLRRVIQSRKIRAEVRTLPPVDAFSPHVIVIDVIPTKVNRDRNDPPPLGEALE